ncbi:ribonuclease III [Carboxylicivirga sp. A043]|uniref:ribonuclease III n=1 Tax=Carboxylicivirga litoralis TaxID=2816963 RepID=UPI0021CB2F32|nr:ribonuclease III [Carboxylicivirga sp. A043]MCU4157909.1 ribonuclease III [Carboxylicivirga sp. A043]
MHLLYLKHCRKAVIKPLLHIIKLFSLRRGKFYSFIKKVTGIIPGDISIYKQAFIHKSAMIKGKDRRFVNNERLEYLGDAMLGAIVANVLYNRFPNKNEGFLTKTRSRIVNRSLLNDIALKMGLGDWVNAQSKIDISQTSILGDALEALIGAVYVDKGYEVCEKFVLNQIVLEYVDLKQVAKKDSNYKSLLIEWGQKHKQSVHFITEEKHISEGAAPTFIARAAVEGEVIGQGEGFSKKEAQQNAARNTLKELRLREAK